MKEFVFLYPIQAYLDDVIEKKGERFSHHELLAKRINTIIDKRYRQRGYGVNWVFFSDPDDATKPDLSLKAREIKILTNDWIIASGVSFLTHIAEKLYPNPSTIINQIPEAKTFRIGGFHQWDCVDKTAKAAFKRTTDTRVDEDTTDVFLTLKDNLCIPMVRDVEYLLMNENDILYNYAVAARKEKPWFAQIMPITRPS